MVNSQFTLRDIVIVNEGRQFVGSVCVEDGRISRIEEHAGAKAADEALFLLPGVIDEHVHFRDPGMTAKADIATESRAAAAGGVTTYFDMPNCVPQTTTLEAWEAKMERAAAVSAVNYAFHFGATNANAALFPHLDASRIPALKVFMGSSTGGMLVEREETLRRIFAESPLPVMTHCEDTATIARNMAACKERYGEDPAVSLHPLIRSREACIASSSLAARLAEAYGTRLLIAHVTTAEELELLRSPHVYGEACLPHLLFTDADYAALGTRIKCNPAVKTARDREALRQALADGRIYTVATDHAPHLLADKQGGAARAASGMPLVQFSLPAMLELVDAGVLTLPRLVELMCHHPARFFAVERRGFLREGYKADFVLVRAGVPWTLTSQDVLSRCGWSPLEGRRFGWRVEQTYCNGRLVYSHDQGVAPDARGEAVTFDR
ncbi:MAG: dihydroorotase [Alloprevotella sp.]|nr:dihydroorotase [Alloprevotella sp.]MBR1652074.1 dihydroorotase [Alloprevotella sp.]